MLSERFQSSNRYQASASSRIKRPEKEEQGGKKTEISGFVEYLATLAPDTGLFFGSACVRGNVSHVSTLFLPVASASCGFGSWHPGPALVLLLPAVGRKPTVVWPGQTPHPEGPTGAKSRGTELKTVSGQRKNTVIDTELDRLVGGLKQRREVHWPSGCLYSSKCPCNQVCNERHFTMFCYCVCVV